MIDPYSILGISRDASDEEVKKAYRKMSRKYHPDANIDNPNKEQAEEKFKQVQHAYRIRAGGPFRSKARPCRSRRFRVCIVRS